MEWYLLTQGSQAVGRSAYEGVTDLTDSTMSTQTLSDKTREEIRRGVTHWIPGMSDDQPVQIHTDTSDFFRVQYNDVVLLDGSPFLVRQNAREGRFGLDDEVKHWVKRAIDLRNFEMKIIKLVFYEKFVARVGDIEFECFRSPKKEARILKLVDTHTNFMHGVAVEDEKGNLVRILDYIYGPSLATYVENLAVDHHTYFYENFPGILENFTACIEGIRFLHENGEKHGDIRRDHILVERPSGHYRWIDFDYNYRHRENIYGYDLFGLGNVLIFLVGKGDVSLHDLKYRNHPALSRLHEEDLNIVFHNRVANLKKIYPYIPDGLNRVLLHFSKGANWFYEQTEQLLEDLNTFRTQL
ncbi:MAG: serine/threonine-protein kinase [Desulfobacterales bacterium]